MRFFMIAAAMSVAALGFSGCASTGGCPTGGCSTGGCSTGGCGAGVIDGCGEAGCTDCQVPQASECSCGGGGCAGCLSGIHGGAPGGYASGLQNTSMALSLFDRGSKCGGGAGCKLGGCKLGGCKLGGCKLGGCLLGRGGLGQGGLRGHLGCGKFGCGRLGLCLACRARGAGAADGCDSCGDEVVENVRSPGLLGRVRAANAAALAEQDAQYAAAGGCGCGLAGCGGGAGCLSGHGLGGGHGCGGRGCDVTGCKDCVRGVLQHSLGQPYGGAVPHTTQPQGPPPAGAAPTYAYPYYTTRGPRDFLAREPASIGY